MINNIKEKLETRDAQIETERVFEVQHKEVAGTDFSTQALQELTVNELVDKWNQLEDDYILLKWKLARLISDKFTSKKEFGQFLQQLRIANPNHALCTINQCTFYRYARAAMFCDKFKIYDLNKVGISPTSIYELSEIKNETVVDDIFVGIIKNQNLPVSEIKRLICQAHSIRGEVIPEPKESIESPEIDIQTQDFKHLESIKNETQTIFNVVEGRGGEVQPVKLTSQSLAIHVEPTIQLAKEAMVQEILNIVERFNLSYQGTVDFFIEVIVKVYEIKTVNVTKAE